MEPTKEEDSFQDYKKYLEDSLGISGILAPPRPHTPYMRFFFERNCQQKSKGNHNLTELSKVLSQEWKKLDDKKKQYYQKIYDVRMRQREELVEQYQFLTKSKKVINGYSRYFKKRFKELSKQNSGIQIKQINKMVASDWKNLSQSQKTRYNNEAATDQAKRQISTEERESRIQEYNESIKKFVEELKQEKTKILKKYGINNLKQQRRLQREKKRDAEKKLKKQQKQKQNEEKKKKKIEQYQAKKKQKKKEQEEKKKQQQQQKKKQLQEKKQQKTKKQAKQPEEPKKQKEAKQPKVEKKSVTKVEKKEATKPKKKVVAKKAAPATKKPRTKAAPKKAVPKKIKKIAKAPKAKKVVKKVGKKEKVKKTPVKQEKQVKKQVKKQAIPEVKIQPKSRSGSKSKPKGRK